MFKEEKLIRLSGTANDSIVDGPGLRFTLFTQGCPHGCPHCHNPQTHDPLGGYDSDADTIMKSITANPLLDGVTLSGGEPMTQAPALLPLVKQIKTLGLNLWVYSGYTFHELSTLNDPAVDELLRYTDVLVDGRYMAEKRSLELPFRGSSNQRLLDVPASLKAGFAVESK